MARDEVLAVSYVGYLLSRCVCVCAYRARATRLLRAEDEVLEGSTG